MKKSYTFLFLAMVALPFISLAQTWLEVGQGGFSEGEAYYQKISIDGTTPYVGYTDEAHEDKGTVMKFSDGSWTPVGAPGFTESILDFDFEVSDGVPYVAYDNYDGMLSVMSNNGGEWSYLGDPNFATVGSIALSVDNGTVYVAFEDMDYEGRISVKKYSNGWEYVGTPGFSTDKGVIAMDMFARDGNVYVVYRDHSFDLKATVMKFDGEAWSVVGNPGFSGGTYDSYNGITVIDGQPYVIAWNSNAQATVYTFAGTSWETVGGEAVSSGQGIYSSIYSSNEGDLYIAYSDGGLEKKVFLKKYNNGAWESVGDAVSLLSGEYVSIATDENGKPYVAYRDNWYMRKTTVMTYGESSGISNPEDGFDVSVYPNPTSGKFFINLGNEEQIIKTEVMNSVGQLVQSSKTASNQIDLSGLNNGVYFVRINTSHGSVVRRVVLK